MFIGEYQANLDEKNRVAVPARFRTGLKSKVVITKGLDNSLFLYTLGEWKSLAEKLCSLPISSSSSRSFARLMLAGAMEVDIDKQGRITLPLFQKEFARIEKAVIFAGLYNRIEIWGQEEWAKYSKSMESESVQIAESLGQYNV